MRARLAAVLVLAAALSACGGADEAARPPAPPSPPVIEVPARSPEPVSPAPLEPAPSPTPPPAAPDLGAVSIALTPVAQLESPIAMATRPGDDALYVAERGGQVRVLRGGAVEAAPLVDISGDTTNDGERGLLGLAFAPDGQHLYLYYTGTDYAVRIDEWTLDGAAVRADSRRSILVQEHPRSNHNGGALAFGPDGLLYAGLGDGGGQGDPNGNGQSLGTLLGKVLRIDPRQVGDAPYGVPSDNPFVADPAARPEVWAYGLRNPWRFSFDRQTGDLWIGDVGQNAIEEVDFLPGGGRGADLGWSDYEGTELYKGEPGADGIAPVTQYDHGDGCSVTGGYVYRGAALPALRGAYVYGDFCSGWLRAAVQSDGALAAEADLGVAVDSLVSFGEDAAGELYALSLSGDVFRLDPA